jgi:hypothetical protein
MKLIVLCFLISLSSSGFTAERVSVDDVMKWIKTEPMLDPPVKGTVVKFGQMNTLRPWMVPGLFEEMLFPGTEIKIQETTEYQFHKSFVDATKRHAGESTIIADGALENYSAGQPFSHEQIMAANSNKAGYMVAWNRVNRWRHYGHKMSGGEILYLGAKSGDAPLDKDRGLNGGGSLDRALTGELQTAILSHLPMLKDQNYRMKGSDSKTTHYKEYFGFLAPHNVAGTKFVVERMLDPHADDQVNIYSPTERRVRRFSAKERADSFMGTNFTLDDIEGFSGRVLDYEWQFLGTKKVLAVSDSAHEGPQFFGPYSRVPQDRWQLRDCYVVEATSVWEGHPYQKRIMFIDAQTFNIATQLVVNREDQLWKVFLVTYKWRGSKDGTARNITESMPHTVMDVAIDLISNTATLAHMGLDLEFPVMNARKVRRVFSVSSLGEGK